MDYLLVRRLFWRFFYIRDPFFLSDTYRAKKKIEMKKSWVESSARAINHL